MSSRFRHATLSLQRYHDFFPTRMGGYFKSSCYFRIIDRTAVKQPPSHGETRSSLACFCRKLFKIEKCRGTSGPPCVLKDPQ
jgi:hypothetical protein